MVRAELNEKMSDVELRMCGDIRAVSTETMWLLKNVGEQLEKLTGVSSRTHIVNMCKLVVEDRMSLNETMDLAEKTMAGKEDPPAEMAMDDKITQLQDRLMEYLQQEPALRKRFSSESESYNIGWNNALCWVLGLTGRTEDLNKYVL